jgi:hypothetical protein
LSPLVEKNDKIFINFLYSLSLFNVSHTSTS